MCGYKINLPYVSVLLRGAGFAVSVGTRYIKLGDFTARQEVSTNRADVFECLSEFTTCYVKKPFVKISPIFLLYFAELYHPSCRQKRGRDVASF